MPAHRPTTKDPSQRSATSSRRQPCPRLPFVLAPACYVDLNRAHEEAALTALADLLVPYLDSDEEAAA
jgi:hypothetical protein